MKPKHGIKLLALIGVVSFSLCCCATKGQQVISRDREYQRMVEMQRQKADASTQEMESKKLPPLNAEDHDRLGDRQERQGNSFLAIQEYQRSLRLDPTRVLTRYKVGRIFTARRLWEEALKEYDTIEAQKPECGLGALGKGTVYFKKREFAMAREHLNKALASNANLWQAHEVLGLISERQKQLDEAIEHYRKALTINPGSAGLYNNLGMSYYAKGDYPSSIDAFLEAVQISPDNGRVYNNLGLALARIGRYDEAFRAFKKGKDEAAAYNNMGCIYFSEGKYGQAIEALEKAMRINPQYYVKAHENRDRAASRMQEEAK